MSLNRRMPHSSLGTTTGEPTSANTGSCTHSMPRQFTLRSSRKETTMRCTRNSLENHLDGIAAGPGIAPRPGWACACALSLQPPCGELRDQARRRGVEARDAQGVRIVRIADGEPVGHHGADDQLRVDTHALAVGLERPVRVAADPRLAVGVDHERVRLDLVL